MTTRRRWGQRGQSPFRFAALVAAALCVAATAGSVAAEPPSSRIVGGKPTRPGADPWMTALVRAGEDPREGQICGATLIGAKRLLTAAHCLTVEEPKRLDAVVGAESLNGDEGERIGVDRYALDPERTDMAQVRLEREAPPGPILAPATPSDGPRYEPGDTATAIGWGLTSQDGGKPSNRLREVDVPIVSDADCEAAYAGNQPPFRPEREICAGAEGRDACAGDSGGPLVVPDGAGGVRQVGVVSSGHGCALARFPGIYAEVPARIEFVTASPPIWAPEPGRSLRVKGRPKVGHKLRCSDGRWSGKQIEFRFFWFARRTARRIDTGRKFVPEAKHAGSRVFCIVVAQNPGGFAFQQSKTVRVER